MPKRKGGKNRCERGRTKSFNVLNGRTSRYTKEDLFKFDLLFRVLRDFFLYSQMRHDTILEDIDRHVKVRFRVILSFHELFHACRKDSRVHLVRWFSFTRSCSVSKRVLAKSPYYNFYIPTLLHFSSRLSENPHSGEWIVSSCKIEFVTFIKTLLNIGLQTCFQLKS